jgi:RNA polymerase sigma factor (sigma-70 family)
VTAHRNGRATPAPDPATDRELLESDDVDSFAEFYRRHARRLAGRLMRATANVEIAADLTAETFAAALAARSRYRPERGTPATWLYGIAAHKLNDWLRRGYAEDQARRRLGIERIPLTEDDVREFAYLAGEVTVVELLDELPREQRAAVRARLVEERDYAEIAGAEGVSEAAIRQRVSRGLAGLRRRIGGER